MPGNVTMCGSADLEGAMLLLQAKRAKDMEFMEAQNRLFAEEFTRRQQVWL